MKGARSYCVIECMRYLEVGVGRLADGKADISHEFLTCHSKEYDTEQDRVKFVSHMLGAYHLASWF